jgi:hypothetical protein
MVLVWVYRRKCWSTVTNCLRHARRMAFLKNRSLLFVERAVHLSIFKHWKTVAFCKHEKFPFLWWIVYLARRAELVDVHIGGVVTISAEIRYHLYTHGWIWDWAAKFVDIYICMFITLMLTLCFLFSVLFVVVVVLLYVLKCQTKYFDNSPKLSLVSLFWHTYEILFNKRSVLGV